MKRKDAHDTAGEIEWKPRRPHVRDPHPALRVDLVKLGVESAFHVDHAAREHERGAPGRCVLHVEAVAREPVLERGNVFVGSAKAPLELGGRKPAVEVGRRGVVLVGEKARETIRVAPRQDENHAIEADAAVEPGDVEGASDLTRH